MAVYVLLGGRSIERLTDFSLEEKIFLRLGLKTPRILFIPLASYLDVESSIRKFEKLTAHTQCKVDYLRNLEDKKAVEKLFSSADVLYFGGGCAEELVRIVRNTFLYELLKNYQSSNKVFMGISAGAILFSKYGMGDRYAYKDKASMYNYQMVQGLGFLDITICPHYDHLGLWCYNDAVKAYGVDGFALEDDTAIVFTPNVQIYKIDSTKSVYLFSSQEDYIMRPLYEVKS